MTTTADPAEAARSLHERIAAFVDEVGVTTNVDRITEIVATAVGLGLVGTDRLDLKITAAALAEMREAFAMFAPYKARPKVTVFGSARTQAHDPLYRQTHDVAEALADAGWMVVTGAGPGIMLAAAEGAGVEQSIGVSIRLPFESRPNDLLGGDPKHVSMKYFFTRKLMLVKESKGFVAMPGGFGTLDETLEVLTLQQTGKAEPTPIVLLDVPGGTYWQGFSRFVHDQLVARGLVADDDLDRVLVTDAVDEAAAEILGFWDVYHSVRWVGKRVVIRLNRSLGAPAIAELNERFAHHLVEGVIEASGPLPPEVADADHLELPRLVMVWNQHHVGALHHVIRAVNRLGAAAS